MLVDPPKTLVFFYAELFLTKPLRTAVGIEKLHYSFKKNLLWSEEHNFVKSNNCTNINKKNLALLLKILKKLNMLHTVKCMCTPFSQSSGQVGPGKERTRVLCVPTNIIYLWDVPSYCTHW